MRVVTNAGNFVIELDRNRAPLTVDAFLKYVNEGFYADVIFHRVVAGFIAQAGGFTADMTQKPVTDNVFNESGNGLSNLRGSVGFARSTEPHSATSQFYVNLADNVDLNPRPTRWGYAVFGKVVEGMDVVDDIGHRPTAGAGSFTSNVPVEPDHHRADRAHRVTVAVLFISDLHLTAGDAETIRRFVEFMDGPARAAEELYILGDLFEAWIGDDDDDPRLAPIVAALRRLTTAGVPCKLMHGNRDFLLGPRFCAQTGCRLLGDYERVTLFGQPVLLTHGDLLCTDDTRYMTLRAELRSADLAARVPRQAARRAAASRKRSAAALGDRNRAEERLHHGRQSGGRGAHDARTRRDAAAAWAHAPAGRAPVRLGWPRGGADRARRLVSRTQHRALVGRRLRCRTDSVASRS